VGCDVLRFLLWRLLAVLAVLAGYVLAGWFLRGGPGRLLRGGAPPSPRRLVAALDAPVELGHALGGSTPGRVSVAVLLAVLVSLAIARCVARRRRDYERVRVDIYRTDHATPMESDTSGRTTSM
jgi:hypothetical protein